MVFRPWVVGLMPAPLFASGAVLIRWISMSYNANREQSLLDELAEKSSRLGIILLPEQLAVIRTYCLDIIEFSKHTNIVGRSEFSVLIFEHVLDSLALVPFLKGVDSGNRSYKLIDIGSGAGFPAVILGIALPGLKATLIEASGKKCRFLDEALKKIGLDDRFSIFPARAEELGHDPDHRGCYDWGTARAVGTFDLSAELVMPFLATGGKFFAQKSLSQKAEESERAEKCLPKLGGKLSTIQTLDAEILGKPRVLIIASKTEPTASGYPRSWTRIKSSPAGT